MIKKTSSGYQVRTRDGKRVLGSHPTEEAAKRQLAAIEAAKARERGSSLFHKVKRASEGSKR